MANPDPVAAHKNPDHVKSIILTGLAMAIDPDASRPGQLPLLSPMNRPDRPAELVTLPGFDLDERHRPFAPDDEVDVSSSVLEPAVDHDPAIPPKPSLRDPLPKFSERLPGR